MNVSYMDYFNITYFYNNITYWNDIASYKCKLICFVFDNQYYNQQYNKYY